MTIDFAKLAYSSDALYTAWVAWRFSRMALNVKLLCLHLLGSFFLFSLLLFTSLYVSLVCASLPLRTLVRVLSFIEPIQSLQASAIALILYFAHNLCSYIP
jgi:hypothetical protein